MKKRRIVKWLVIIIGIYLAGGILLYFFQEKIMFRGVALPADYKFHFNIPFKEINLAVNNEKNLSIIRFTVPDSVCKGVVLYFHGNRQNILRYAPYAKNFTRNNYEVWMMDYPGYGKSTGERTEEILYDDALRLYRMARARFSADSIILYGRSLGSGIVCQLASIRDCKRVILETPYYSGHALAKHFFPIYPVKLMKYSFRSDIYAEKIAAPISIFHGTKDELIPISQSKKLMKKIRSNAELIIIEKGRHNNLNDFENYQQKLDSLLRL